MVYPANVALTDGVLSWDYINDPTTFAYEVSAVTNDGATTERRSYNPVFSSPFSFNGDTLADGDVGVRGQYETSDWSYVVFGVSDGFALTQENWYGTGSTASGGGDSGRIARIMHLFRMMQGVVLLAVLTRPMVSELTLS